MPLRQMRGRITEALREPLRKLYESHHAAPHFEEHHAMWGIADYSVSNPNTSGMVKAKVGVLLSTPFPDMQAWTRGLEPTNGGTMFPSEVLPPASTAGRVARDIPPRVTPPAPDAWAGICVRETPSIQPTDRSNPSAIMGTDLCTSELLEGLYGAKPTMMILSTQPTINISMEEMNTAISEHSTGFFSLLFPPWGTWPEQVSTTTTAPRGP